MRGEKNTLSDPAPIAVLPGPKRGSGLRTQTEAANLSDTNGQNSKAHQNRFEGDRSRLLQLELALRRQTEKLNALAKLVERLVKDQDQAQLETHHIRET